MSQYDLTITYIHGEDNTVADALSRLPPNCFADEIPPPSCVESILQMCHDNFHERLAVCQQPLVHRKPTIDTLRDRYLQKPIQTGTQFTQAFWRGQIVCVA